MMRRRHGWQRPLHPLQIVGMSVFSLLVAAFYCFLALFLGSETAEITVTTIFSFAALSAAILFIRCTWIDPSDKTRYNRLWRSKRNRDNITRGRFQFGATIKYGCFVLRHLFGRVVRRMERKILKSCIRRKYLLLLPPRPPLPMESLPPLRPFPLVVKDDDYAASVAPHPNDPDISFCSICDFEVQKHSKHCRTCNRCVEGFDHHCRWLNNCVGKKNYTTFILLMVFVLIMLIVEGGTAIAIFVRCFADQKGINQQLKIRHYANFPRGLLAAVSVLLLLITAYSSAALGQLFFFHVLLIQKGMRTYDYILAMKEEKQFTELESSEDSDFSSDESIDLNSPEKPSFITRSSREGEMSQKLSIRIEGGETTPSPTLNSRTQGFRASINPWKLVTMSQERALLAASRAKERLMMQKTSALAKREPLKPLPLETQKEPPMKSDENNISSSFSLGMVEKLPPGSPAKFSSPRRRLSSSCTSSSTTLLAPVAAAAAAASMTESPEHRYFTRSSFDLQQLTRVSQELEGYISRQVSCYILRKDGNEMTSP